MVKRLSSVIAILLVLLSVTACQDKAVDMTSAIPLSVSVSEPEDVKLITYDGSVSGVSGDIETVEISVYEGSSATGTPEATGTLSLSGGSATAVITNVIPGLYTITADGYSGNHQLTHDSVTKRIIPSSSDVSIVLSTFQTADPVGTITITPSFSDDAMSSAIESGSSFTATWTLYGGDALDEETATGTTSISPTPFTLTPTTGSIAPGRYILKATVTSDGRSYYAVSALRLLPGLPASGDLVFGLDGGAGEAGGESLTLVVTDSTGAVIPMTDGGIVSDDDKYTLSIGGLTKEPQSVIVYANGERLTPTAMSYSSGVEKVDLTITESAIYDILVVVLDGTASGVGSLHFEMTVNKPTFIIKQSYVYSVDKSTDFDDVDKAEIYYYPSNVNSPKQTKAIASPSMDYGLDYNGDAVYRIVNVEDHADEGPSYSVDGPSLLIEAGEYIAPEMSFDIWNASGDTSSVNGYILFQIEKMTELPIYDIRVNANSFEPTIRYLKFADDSTAFMFFKVWDKNNPENNRMLWTGESEDIPISLEGEKSKAPIPISSLSLNPNSEYVICGQYLNIENEGWGGSVTGLTSPIIEMKIRTDNTRMYLEE